MGAPMEVPSAHETQADRIVNPPPAEEKSVKDALGSPAKKKITVKGKVVQEDEIKTVSVRGEEVKIKTIMLKDSTETAKITLWRDLATADTRPGDYIQVTDVVVNIYNNQASLQTTSRSNVKKSEVPEVKKVVTVEGICIDDTEAELFLDDESTLQIELCILLSALSLESDEDIMANGSFKLDVVCSGDRILSAIAAT